MNAANDNNKVWKRPLGCLLWCIVIGLVLPFLAQLFVVVYALFFTY